MMDFNSSDPASSMIVLGAQDGEGDLQAVRVERLDDCSAKIDGYNNIIIKLDVEGFEKQVLYGALKALKDKRVVLMVEDFITTDVGEYLQKNGFTFLDKLTPYNSWWVKDAGR